MSVAEKIAEHERKITEMNSTITNETMFQCGCVLYKIETIYKSGDKLKLKPVSHRFEATGMDTIFPPCRPDEKNRIIKLTYEPLRGKVWVSRGDFFHIYKEGE